MQPRPGALHRPQGLRSLDGISLTVNEVSDNRFGVNIIPHTLTDTTWGAKTPGDGSTSKLTCSRATWRGSWSSARDDTACKHVISEGQGFLSSIAEIIEDMRNGRMVMLVDAEERENEGDLVIPAQMATPDAINFMAKHGRGLDLPDADRAARRRARLE